MHELATGETRPRRWQELVDLISRAADKATQAAYIVTTASFAGIMFLGVFFSLCSQYTLVLVRRGRPITLCLGNVSFDRDGLSSRPAHTHRHAGSETASILSTAAPLAR